MAEAVVSFALETLHDLLLDEAKLLGGVRSEVRRLESQLKEVKFLLKDAQSKRHDNNTVRGWIGEIRDLVYRAEDAIELYAAVRGSSRRGRGRGRRRRLKQLLRRCSCILKEGSSLHQIATEISHIKSEIARVTKIMQDYGLRSIIQGESSASDAPNDNQQWQRKTFPFETEDVFVGKDKELEQLVSLVVDDEEHRVISLWGMGGIGKTTMARKVYNHHKTKRFFESFAWVCISQQCQIRSVLEDVLKQLISQPQRRDENSSNLTDTVKGRDENSSKLSDTELMGQLCEIQKAKRCMIVIDDIWRIDHWEGLKRAFLLQGTKSKILLTTRKQNVSDIGYAFMAGLLNEDEGWELLKKKAFPHSNVPNFQFEEELLEKIGKEMVRKCGKLPLAISLLGGILSKKKSMTEWKSVNENIRSLYRGDEGLENEKPEIQGVLNLSYEELPYYLKLCFLDMGRYKEDEIISANKLCMRWIALGMISYENNESNEVKLLDIAHRYLKELASRCVVEILSDYAIRGLEVVTCKLHDVVRELCLSMGKKEDFGLQILDYETAGKFTSLLNERLSGAKTRHLVINFEQEIEPEGEELTITCDEDTAKLVRSLHFKSCTSKRLTEFPHSIIDLKKFKLLKVLVFEGFDFVGKKLPRGIDKLIHLRQLCLWECKCDKLPSSISNLVYLHTLHLNLSKNIRIPNNVLNKMFRLKHLYLPDYDVEEMGSYTLRLEGLDELEILSGFNSLVHELESVTQMKNLRYFLGEIHDNKCLSEIMHVVSTSWNNLWFCGFHIMKDCCVSTSEEDLMNFKKLFTSPNLHALWIYVPIGKVLQESQNQIHTSNLVIVILVECEIEEDPMEILGKLPLLGHLHFIRSCFVGEEMTCRAFGFPRLKNLIIDSLPNLREWKVEKGAMPLVFEIVIDGCPLLEMIPFGFKFLVALRELKIIGMPKLIERVCDEEGEDFDKVRHVPSIITS